MPDPWPFPYRLRPHQAQVLAYERGRMAVSAVPGSGKTLTLALLAARLILAGKLGDAGEVLVVTVQNSAVDNIAQRIRRLLVEQKLPPVGYHVCTLHKLASDILRERCDLAGVEEHFVIVDDAESRRCMRNAAEVVIAGRRAWWESYLPQAESEAQHSHMLDKWQAETESVGREVTKLCKHLRLTPEAASQLVSTAPQEAREFLELGVELYTGYARYLRARNGLDFDDLIWRALDALEQDPTFLANLRVRWPYLLEDEAQDSSPLQERVLGLLCGSGGNWVRVGDPNQSINSTFTAADPRYFRRFLQAEGVTGLTLPESGRSGAPIMALANHLVHWTCHEHPETEVQAMAFQEQDIRPTAAEDTQRNPPAGECHIHLRDQPFLEVASEAAEVARWAANYSRRYPERTVAILCPAQWQGGKVVEALQAMRPEVPYDDLLRSTPQMRNVSKVLAAICAYLGAPTSRRMLARLLVLLAEEGYLEPVAGPTDLKRLRTLLDSLAPQSLLFPREAANLCELLPPNVQPSAPDLALLQRFAALVGRWVRGLALPIDQLLLTIAQDLFSKEEHLAICHTLATSLRATSEMQPNWRLPNFAAELDEVARNQRSLTGLSLADAGYVAQAGRVVVTTMHKAKGLEWDAVYLLCVDNLEFPDNCSDVFRDELYFMPGRAPSVEARKHLERLAGSAFAAGAEQPPVEQARLEVIAERLRLLYVGITRARRDLAVTCSAKNGQRTVRPALALRELQQAQRAYGF